MNRKRFTAFALMLLALLLFSYQLARAQANVQAGSIQGTITDPQGAVVPDAKITITNKDTGAVTTTTTTSAGAFSSGSLTPGNYSVRVEAPNFKTTEVSVTVLINVVSSANVRLAIGASSAVIEVSANAVNVNTEQAQVSGSLTTQQIENLPVNGRNFLDLAQLEPGVQIQDGSNFDPTKTGFASISFGGRFGRSARIAVDGVDISDENVGTTTTGIPSSAIAEFQLAQSSLDLSNDLSSSGAVNVATKSGTNTIHGEGFGLFRDNSQAAAFPGAATFQRNQYGGDVGGAVIKDKLFYFVDAERTLQHAAAGVPVSAPFDSFSGTFPSPYHETDVVGKLDWQATKALHLFGRYSFFQNLAVDSFGGSSSFSFFGNKDRTRSFVGGADFNTGSFTHSFRAEYLKFVNNLGDAVRGSGVPFADFPVSIATVASQGLTTGPSFIAPQESIQSDRQVKYDGSKVWGSHILRYGVGYNRITGFAFASFFGLAPQFQIQSFIVDPTSHLTCSNGVTDAACPLNYIADAVRLGNGQGSFTELSRFGKPTGGLGPDNRFGAYAGDSWKVKPNLTLTYGVRYVRDTGRTDSDLPAIPVIDSVLPGQGRQVHEPNHNFAPQAGFAWDPHSDGKTVIRAGIGLFYDNNVFNNILFDRLLRITNGAFNVAPFACLSGGAAAVVFPAGNEFVGGSKQAGSVICGSPLGATLGANAGNCAGLTFANCLAGFQNAYQAATAANPTGPNPAFIGNLISGAGVIPAGLLDPSYKTPRSIQMNAGFQREIRPGMVLTMDYLRNVGLHYLLNVDVNHSGDVAFFNKNAAQNAINRTLLACGAANITAAAAPGGCLPLHSKPGDNGAATIADFAARGLDSASDQGIGGCFANLGFDCAFPGVNSSVGVFDFGEPAGRSVYNAMDIKLTQNVNHPLKGVKYANLQFAYTLSRYDNAGAFGSTTQLSSSDQDFASFALDNRNPNRFSGPSSLDRTHQFNIGGYADLPIGFRLGVVSHFWSPLSATPSVLPVTNGPGAIFQTDFSGDGTVGDPLPGFKQGAFGRDLSVNGLMTAIANYNANVAGNPTPAGQTLINAGVITAAQLKALGGVAPTVQAPPANQVGLGWLKGMDVQLSWIGHAFHERLTLQPSVGIFNLFNFVNFDSPANALSGQLSGTAGAINGATPQNRADRIGAGSGLFQFGAPRVIEWGMKFTF
ncbi:MAG TPA: carboxypeptidase regulatory-like domain-containing protein [Candidatus Limnocylindria bacterium]|nr:carboxypeptidase regulatory-like domain-containing protein [Candidatus Limnocylindria bacterium]